LILAFQPHIHHRRSIRLRDFDYSQSAWYFVTICTHERQCLLGEVVDGQMTINACGQIINDAWAELPAKFSTVKTHDFVVMPNHIHGVIELTQPVGAQFIAPNKSPTLGQVVRAFKAKVTFMVNQVVAHKPFWQTNYYEHIIRDEAAYLKIADYIQTNPQRWVDDTYYV
jgi:REP element-mobilizing transposase RayT